MQFVHKIAPRGIYTSGKGSSAVGLTACITKDPWTKEQVLEGGALVLSDRGVCCIDEFDKMTDATRSILHEVMEQQTVSIAKAGIVCTLSARTSILASANPKQSRYNPRMSVMKNLELSPALLSRFDLIYIILDKPNEANDRKLAMYITSFYYPDEEKDKGAGNDNVIARDTLAAYISHARKYINPELNDGAKEELVSAYVKMREGNVASKGTIFTTPRQLESLIRLSESFARMKLSNEVTADDVKEASKLMRIATQTEATDSATGQIDMSLLS
jgi:DNA replication licensing factor MCM4